MRCDAVKRKAASRRTPQFLSETPRSQTPIGGVRCRGSGGSWGRNQRLGERKSRCLPQPISIARAAVLLLRAGVRPSALRLRLEEGRQPLSLHPLFPKPNPCTNQSAHCFPQERRSTGFDCRSAALRNLRFLCLSLCLRVFVVRKDWLTALPPFRALRCSLPGRIE
jgi:hypothetical protein